MQDNIEILLLKLKSAHPWTEQIFKSEWINIKHKLIALIMLAFSVIFDQVFRVEAPMLNNMSKRTSCCIVALVMSQVHSP